MGESWWTEEAAEERWGRVGTLVLALSVGVVVTAVMPLAWKAPPTAPEPEKCPYGRRNNHRVDPCEEFDYHPLTRSLASQKLNTASHILSHRRHNYTRLSGGRHLRHN